MVNLYAKLEDGNRDAMLQIRRLKVVISHSRSSTVSLFDRTRITSYLSFIATTALSCAVRDEDKGERLGKISPLNE